MRKMVGIPKLFRYGTLGLGGLLLLIIFACGDDAATPLPTATPVDVGSIVQEAVQAAVAQSAPALSEQELRSLVETAVTAAVPEAMTPAETQALVEAAVAAAATPGLTAQEVAALVSKAVSEAAASGPTPLTAAQVQSIVRQAIAAVPTPTPQPTATPAPSPTPIPVVDPRRGGNIKFSAIFPGFHWDMLEGGAFNTVTMNQFLPLLIQFNPESRDRLELGPDLATSWDVENGGQSYVFHLNENARWDDGVPMGAADVKWTMDEMVNEDEPRQWSGFIKPFYESTEIIDDHTVRLNLKFASGIFLQYLASNYFTMLPKHHYENMSADDRKLKENILGGGPWKLRDYDPTVSWSYDRNEDYWKEGLPYLDTMETFLISAGGAMAGAYKTGQVHMSRSGLLGLSNAEAINLAEDLVGHAQIRFGGPMSHINLYMNINNPDLPYADVRVRRAIHLAVNRQDLIAILTLGKASLGYPFMPDFWFSLTEAEVALLPGFRVTADGQKDPRDIATAKQLMIDAGYPDGFKTDSLSRNFFGIPEMAQVVADQLREIGIDMSITVTDNRTADARRDTGDYEILPQSDGTNMVDPEDAFARLYTSASATHGNFIRWTNPRVDELYDLQARTTDRALRRQYTLEAAEIVLQEVPVVSLYWADRAQYVDDRVKNFNMPNVWFARNYKDEHLWCDPKC
jgi:peptide/nickel transport system substrate-binding protein